MYEVIKAVNECYKDLADAIVLQAVDDYKRIIRSKRFCDGYARKDEKKKLIAFFKSDWFYFLTNISGEEILNRLDKEHEQEKKGKRRVVLSSGK